MRSDGFVGNVADAAFDAIINAVMACRAEGFVVIRGHAERSAQLLVEAAQVTELCDADRNLGAVMREEKLLIASIPQVGELALRHDRGNHGHLEATLVQLAQFGAAIVFLDANNSARAADREALLREAFNLRLNKCLIDVPHGTNRIRISLQAVKPKNLEAERYFKHPMSMTGTRCRIAHL